MKNIFTKSNDYKQEYSCSIVKIDDIKPIEGSDFLGQTLVNGFPIVVRKDQIKSGDILFYAPIECELDSTFCNVNNLYEDNELNEDHDKKGYFNKYGRVRIIKLRGVPSMGYLFGLNEVNNLLKANGHGTITEEDMVVGTDFDTISGDLFVKAFIPRISSSNIVWVGNKDNLKNRLKRFDCMIPGEFSPHYSTAQFERELRTFNPDDDVTVSVKLHGTSIIIGNIKIREPRFGGLYAKYFEYLPKILRFIKEKYDYVYSSRKVILNKDINPDFEYNFNDSAKYTKYYELFSKNNLLPKGVTIYGEIVGYNENGKPIQKIGGAKDNVKSDKKTDNAYDYGCNVGENKLMIYRINETLPDGTHYEWDVMRVLEWTKKLISEHQDMAQHIHPIDVLYSGKLGDLYPDLDQTNHWHENLLERMKNEKEWFMEMNEPLCKCKVPREGVVIRKNGDVLKEAFKLKTMKFRFCEEKSVSEGNIDVEMLEEYGGEEN